MSDQPKSNGSISTAGGRVDPIKLEHRLTALEHGLIRIEDQIENLAEKIDRHDTWGRKQQDRNLSQFTSFGEIIVEMREHAASCSTRWDVHEDEHEHLQKRNIVLDVITGMVAFFAAIAAWIVGGNP